MPEPGSAEFQASVSGQAGDAAVQAQEGGGMLSALAGMFADDDTVDVLSGEGAVVQVAPTQVQTLDMRNVTGLRDSVLATLRQHGIDPETPQQTQIDAASVPGLQSALMEAFKTHGVDLQALGMQAARQTFPGAVSQPGAPPGTKPPAGS
jgi:hypothetical protein